MIVYDFKKKLSSYFSKPSDQIIVEVENYLNQIPADHLENLYEWVLDNHEYKTFPNRAQINKFYQQMLKSRPDRNYQNARNKYEQIYFDLKQKREKWKTFKIKHIWDILHKIHGMQKKCIKLSLFENDFWAIYGDLYFETIKTKGWEIEKKKNHLQHIKECLENGEYFERLEEKKENKFTEKANEYIPFEKTVKLEDIF
jgi:hypothetical protein